AERIRPFGDDGCRETHERNVLTVLVLEAVRRMRDRGKKGNYLGREPVAQLGKRRHDQFERPDTQRPARVWERLWRPLFLDLVEQALDPSGETGPPVSILLRRQVGA